jgi:hypothetical protein
LSGCLTNFDCSLLNFEYFCPTMSLHQHVRLSTLVQWKTTSLAIPFKRNFLFFYFFEHIYCRQLKKSKKWTCELFLWERILNLAFQMRSNKQNWILPDSIACFYEWKQDPKTDGFKLKTIWLKGIYEQNLALLKQVDCNENELRSQFVSQRKPINVITTDNVIKLKEIFRSQLSY